MDGIYPQQATTEWTKIKAYVLKARPT